MTLILSETFASGIPAGFAVSVDDVSPMTATYNAGQQAVDLVKGGFNSAWRIDACPAGVSSTRRFVRRNRRAPSSSSRRRICWLNGGCEM